MFLGVLALGCGDDPATSHPVTVAPDWESSNPVTSVLTPWDEHQDTGCILLVERIIWLG